VRSRRWLVCLARSIRSVVFPGWGGVKGSWQSKCRCRDQATCRKSNTRLLYDHNYYRAPYRIKPTACLLAARTFVQRVKDPPQLVQRPQVVLSFMRLLHSSVQLGCAVSDCGSAFRHCHWVMMAIPDAWLLLLLLRRASRQFYGEHYGRGCYAKKNLGRISRSRPSQW